MSDPFASIALQPKKEENKQATQVVGGKVGFFEEEPEPKTGLENPFSAFGEIKFNLDLQLPTQVASTLFEAGKWTVIGAGEAVGDLLQQVKGPEAPKNLQKPEDEEKKMRESLTHRQSLEIFKRAEEKVPQQTYAEMVAMALRMGVNVETLADKLQTPLRKEALLKTYYIALGETVANAEKKAAEQAQRNQNMAETNKKGSDNSMRLDAQEGNSKVANQITSAG